MVLELGYTAETPKEDLLLSVIMAGFKGVGKTSAALSFPSPFWFDHDGGLNNVAGERRVPNLYAPSYEQMLDVTMAVQRAKRADNIVLRLPDSEGKLADVEVPCRTVVIDSATKAHRKFLESAMRVGNRSSPTQADWGLASQRMCDIVDMLKPFVNVVVVCHFEIIRNAITEEVQAQIRLPGQLIDLLPIACDELWRFKSDVVADAGAPGGRKRRVQMWTISDGMFPGATRFARRGMPAVLDVTDKDRELYSIVMSHIK